MIPVVALIGRTNVGKSTLFNRLTKSNDAIVADYPGLTRDRKYGIVKWEKNKFILIDTIGIDGIKNDLNMITENQSIIAIEEADIVIFMVDSRVGLITADKNIAKYLRKKKKKTIIVANKIDGMDFNNSIIDFFSLGMGKIFPISAVHGQNIKNFINKALLPNFIKIKLKKQIENNVNFIKKKNLNFKLPIKIAIVGRPNVGKSTLTNYFIKKDRMVVFHLAGTTRDSIYIPIKINGKYYIIIDTAGIIKKFKVKEKIEKFSVIKTIQAIDNSNVVLLVINAIEGITNNDLSIIGMILKSGKSIVIAVNKWDKINLENVEKYKKNIYLRFRFINFAKIHFISALYGSGIKNLFNSINEAYKFANKEISTANITRIMHLAIEKHNPPLVRKNKIKLKYAHVGGYNPPLFIIHGTKLKYLPNYYKRYLINFFRDSLKIIGTPICLFFKETRNPYIFEKKKK